LKLLISPSLPSSPRAMMSRISRTFGSKAWVWPTTRCTLYRSTAAMMVSQSASVSAIGFSRMMCLPCSAASTACGA
jgi:hypothetical protein